jgi:hypothetical protein
MTRLRSAAEQSKSNPFGPATKVDDTRSHAWDPHDRAKRVEAKGALNIHRWCRPGGRR